MPETLQNSCFRLYTLAQIVGSGFHVRNQLIRPRKENKSCKKKAIFTPFVGLVKLWFVGKFSFDFESYCGSLKVMKML